MSFEQYVNQNLGAAAEKLLTSVRIGGDNNAKGNIFERHFSAHKVIEAWANAKHSLKEVDIEFTPQELGFVDDLTIKHRSPAAQKINFQAKNSQSYNGAYTKEMHKRFELQEKIDKEFWGFIETRQVLVVSCPNRNKLNQNLIKRHSKSKKRNFSSEYFPFEQEHKSLFTKSNELRGNLELICSKTDLSSLDYGFRLVLAAMEGSKSFSLSSVIDNVRQMAKPDIFDDGISKAVIPKWLIEVSKSWTDIVFDVKSRDFYVRLNGMDIRLSIDIAEPDASKVEQIKTKADLIKLLIDLASQEFNAEQAQEE
jgi:hypothetical protein